MRSRSHRLPISDPHDDWVDGSWTVDCVCGVNFDDGEEMVNCDECGVWVHTRCSRYVKSEKLFACDKCKIKNSTRNDSEETEVAQLLVELPTKTLRMDNPYPPSSCPPRRPFRLWTDMPMEERVHVQGIPGGDPAIFGELSSVFGPQLWKCTGYVPKKFNFQYREFPSWEEKQDVVDVKGNEEKESVNTADKGADVLFSLSKENFSPSHTRPPAAAKNQVDGGGVGSLSGSDENKKLEGADSDVRRSYSGEKKDRNLIQPIVIHSSKSKKEDLLAFKDRIGKKKAMFVEKDVDAKKRAASASKTVLTISSDAKQLEFCEDKGPVILDSRCGIRGNFLDTTPTDSLSGGSHAADRYVGDSKNNLASGEHPPHILTADVARPNSLVEAKPKEGNADSKHETRACIESSLKPCDGRGSSADFRCVPTKEEVCANALHNSNDDEGISVKSSGTESQESKPFVDDSEITTLEMMKSQKVENPNGNVQSSVKVKVESDVNTGEVSNAQSAVPTNKLNGSNPLLQHAALWTDQKSENVGAVNNSTDNLETSDHKAQDILKSTEVTLDCQKDKVSESPTDLCQLKALSGVSDSSTGVGKSSSEHKQCSKHSEDSTKTGSVNLSPSMALNQRKVPVGKLSSTSLPTVSAKSSDSDNCKPASGLSNIISAKQRGISDCTVSKKRDYISADLVMDKDGHERPRKKDYASADAVRNKDGHERPKKISEELPKPDVSSVSKELHSSKSSTSNLKRTVSDSKDHSLSSSNKTSLAQSIVHAPDSVEAASALLSDGVSHAENGLKASNTHQKGEKVYHSSCQPSSKLGNALPMNPPAASNSPATLSDEELALLLHQELNSSPRVPRVPRMRHAGSLPQLPSPTATSMLMKRTSNSGGKDNNLVPRGKSKDLARDGSRSSRELDDETKKIERVTSPDQKTHDSARPAYPTTKKETDIGRSTKGAHSGKRSVPTSLTTTACSGPSSSTEANEKIKPSTRNGRHINSDDNIGNVGRPAHCTLPALLAEIMGEGKRMTYEELCNAVLPHWPNLRKHNGERYAYSSHSQAVLDCLRNRHEWARLVDRGPKTNPTRKKRRTDADPSGFESEDNECSRERNAKDVDSKCFDSHPEEFPKGKRKARKRRRLALDGRGIKDIRRKRKADVVSDVDDVSFSDSSDESVYSEDEIQGVGACPVGNEASASSDEAGTMS